VAPRLSTVLLRALLRGDDREAERLRALFLPLEDLRDQHSPLRVLHAAVAAAGIADTGPLLPFLANIEAGPVLTAIEAEARRLLSANQAMKAAAE
jgi:dihydrodipicolinate synthase/N-acetylneuraminate lyase